MRAFYDLVAREYAEKFSGELAHKPVDCEVLRRFASELRGTGPVYDLGCGPGQTTGFLNGLGVPARGLDLSPKLLAEARARHHGIEFDVGDMLALPIPDGVLGGVVAFYSIVHFSPEQLHTALVEMHRTLRIGGRLLVAFHVGSGAIHVDEFLGKPASLDFNFFDPIEIAAELALVGFVGIEIVERDPYPDVEFPSRRAYVFATRHSS